MNRMARRKCVETISRQWDAMEMTSQCFSIRTNLIENELQSVRECRTRRRDQEQVAARRAKWRAADCQGDPCRRRATKQKMFVSTPTQPACNFFRHRTGPRRDLLRKTLVD